jgi:hypothetical protein
MQAAYCRSAPLVAPNVHQHTHEPRLLGLGPVWHPLGRLRNPQERFLHEVQGIVATRNEPTSDAVQAVSVRVEQG